MKRWTLVATRNDGLPYRFWWKGSVLVVGPHSFRAKTKEYAEPADQVDWLRGMLRLGYTIHPTVANSV